MDAEVLARIQFAANISFHILFPTITIGLCWLLVYFRLRFTWSKDSRWEYAYYFWVKVFALTFSLGVVSGVTMSFQFGTNWPGFMEKAGNIAGPLLGYEVLTAFFLEASFLGIMLFGKQKVSNRMHLAASLLVAFGTSMSAFWILSLNSWMQTPTGYEIKDGIFYAKDWLEIIFNPSFPYRFFHMLIASLLTASFLIAGVSAWRMLRKVDGPATLEVMKTGIFLAAFLAPLQAFVGDLHGLNTLEHQPAKIAAMEGIWHTESQVPFTVFGWLDETAEETRWAVKIPYAASLILKHDPDATLQGLSDFPGETPPVGPVFWSFRMMLGIGGLMILTAWWCGLSLWRKQSLSKGQYRLLSWMTFSGWVAVLAGWYVTEIGRQPYIVYGLLKVEDVVADHPPEMVLTTLIGYLALYGFLLVSYIYTLRHLASKPAQSLTLVHEYATRSKQGGA